VTAQPIKLASIWSGSRLRGIRSSGLGLDLAGRIHRCRCQHGGAGDSSLIVSDFYAPYFKPTPEREFRATRAMSPFIGGQVVSVTPDERVGQFSG
jgi:hypothetical protein